MSRTSLAAALAACLAAFSAVPAVAATAQEQRAQQTAQIPVCSRNLGTLAVIEPDTNWWSANQLPSPAALIKVFVSRSHCFTLLDRGKGMAAMQAERELASSGDLRGGSNLGKGQVKAADYVLVPDLVSQNNDAAGNNIGALLGGLVGNNNVGALVGGLNIRKKTADVVLTVTDVRSTRQLATIDGHSKKTDVGFAVGGGVFGGGGFGAGGATGYNNTEIGQVIMLAYIDAYAKLVDQLGGALPVEGASAANARQTVIVNRATRMFKGSATSSGLVQPLNPGTRLYPTGKQEGLMWEVQDEKGNLGWVSNITFDLEK